MTKNDKLTKVSKVVKKNLLTSWTAEQHARGQKLCLSILQIYTICILIPSLRFRSLNDNSEEELRHMLELLRIQATTHVLNWVPEVDVSSEEPAAENHLTAAYLMSACETVRRRSSETAVTFLYLPTPPTKERDYVKYLDSLTTLTDNWPPTLMIRGVSPVTSTTL